MRTLLLLITLTIPALSLAGPEPRRNAVFSADVEESLQVTDQQRQAIRQIYQEHRRNMQQLREDTQHKIDAVLSEEQRTLLRSLHSESPSGKTKNSDPEKSRD